MSVTNGSTYRVLALVAVGVLILAQSALAAKPASSTVTDAYGTATAPALRLPSSSGSAAMRLWEDDGEVAAPAYSSRSASCSSACCAPVWYGEADLLIWWLKGNPAPPLVATSPDGTPRPDAAVVPGADVLVGGRGIDDNYRPGVRITLGRWLDPCQYTGVEATWFNVGDGANSGNFYGDSNTYSILGRPFYDIGLGLENAQLVAFPNVVEGSIETVTESDLNSVSVLLRRNLSDDCCRRIDLVGGYRYVRFREALSIYESIVSIDPGGLVPVGTTFDVLDVFGVENDFHGGEIGLDTLFRRGCWDFNVLTKLAIGNMHQTALIDGLTIIDMPYSDPTVGAAGVLAVQSNRGTTSWDEFALIPELNLGVRYHFSERLSLALGYSLLWITDVARTGQQIDRVINTTQWPVNGGVPIGPARPEVLNGHSDMWVQGLNLGVVFEY